MTVRARHRGTYWQPRKRERTPRVANRASDCRVLARIANYEGGAERDAASWSGRRKIYLPPFPTRARSTSPICRHRAVISPAQLLLQRLPPFAPMQRGGFKQLQDSDLPPLSPSHDEKTEKSSLSFARRSVSDG